MAVNTEGRLLEDTLHTASEDGLKFTLDRLKQRSTNPKHRFNTISSFSLLTEEIRETVRAHEIDLIITGTLGASGLKEVFVGSNTVRIIKTSRDCPVIAVPHNYEIKKPKQIALVTDLKRNFHAGIIRPLKEIATHLGASIKIMHIKEENQLDKYQRSNLSILEEYLDDVPTSVHWMPFFANKAVVIQTFLDELEIDLLAMINYKHGFLEELTREPVIKKMAFHTNIPLLTIPD